MCLGSSGVALGAFGAHALKERLLRKAGASENWRTVFPLRSSMVHTPDKDPFSWIRLVQNIIQLTESDKYGSSNVPSMWIFFYFIYIRKSMSSHASDSNNTLRNLAAVLGSSGVALGAFGAHALKERLLRKAGASENWRTAVTYQLLHAVALLSLSSATKPQSLKSSSSSYSGGQIMAWGTVMFSGSIYLLCLDIGPKKLLGPITPIGGLMMISGWVLVGMGKY